MEEIAPGARLELHLVDGTSRWMLLHEMTPYGPYGLLLVDAPVDGENWEDDWANNDATPALYSQHRIEYIEQWGFQDLKGGE